VHRSQSSAARIGVALIISLLTCAAWAGQPAPPKVAPPKAAPAKDPFRDQYKNYTPPFLWLIREGSSYAGVTRGWPRPESVMRLSTEPSFFTLNMIHEDSRANALVEAAREREKKGQFREALKMYQLVIDNYPDALFRASKYGVFVPISQYCQRRILNFPASDLVHYRTLYDARARESFEQARRKHSLIGLSEVVDGMLATSYGGRAIVELGNASLDAGHYLAALERFGTIHQFFPRPELRTPELDLKAAYCQKMLGRTPAQASPAPLKTELSKDQLARLRQVIASATPDKAPYHQQRASAPYAGADDYALYPPTKDPMMLIEPEWNVPSPGPRRNFNDYFVFSQPVVTDKSVIYRRSNIVYCRSLLNGELRWRNDLGGRATWQSREGRQYPIERVLVQDGLVFTVLSKGGPSLVALDETTGQLKWAYGPMVAATAEEARMRFEAAPAGGPMTVYVGYVLDNIEGNTHTDTEYGLIAFESTTGRLRWRRPLSTLAPGKFSAGFAVRRRNRIRSFTSPPLYHQGTVYYNTNAGAVAAVESLSGRVKWLMRYPYWPQIHDATRAFGSHRYQYNPPWPHRPMFWYNQRPLIIGERMFILPVDSTMMMCLDRRTGKVVWSRAKVTKSRGAWNFKDPRSNLYKVGDGGVSYFLGPMRSGELVLVHASRGGSIHLVDPKTGRSTWVGPDLLKRATHPVMKDRFNIYTWAPIGINSRRYCTAAKPMLTTDDKLYVPSFAFVNTGSYGLTFGWSFNLCALSLKDRKILNHRRYYSGELLAMADYYIHSLMPGNIKKLEKLPHKNKQTLAEIVVQKRIAADTVPTNEHGPFMPMQRMTFHRYGVLFELRWSTRNMRMVFDRAAVNAALAKRADPEAVFARAELALADSRLADASKALKTCLGTVSSEDLDFRALIKQQLFRVHKRLARSAIRAAKLDDELENVLGMSRTASVLPEEIETLFALADAYERRGDLKGAARCLRSIINTYGHHEYPVAPVAVTDPDKVMAAANKVLDEAGKYVNNPFYKSEMKASLELVRKGLPLYFSTVSPLPKPLTVRAGELAAQQLIRIQRGSAEFAKQFGATAGRALGTGNPEEKLYRMWEFPGTPVAQKTLGELFDAAAKMPGAPGRLRRWTLADAARVGGLVLPKKFAPQVSAPPPAPPYKPVALPARERTGDLRDAQGINWLVLERRGDRTKHPNLAFLGGRVRKRLDNKFVMTCRDLATGKELWKKPNIRLKGTGQEPGFFEVFVHGDLAVVHGLYDVIAFEVKTGKIKWRYRGPFDFEIKHAVMSGDLLVLAGKAETLALYLATDSPTGELAWQMKELGDIYIAPYFVGDRLISVRKMPFGVTSRYRATGKMIGRLELPDLSLHERHPLLDKGPRALPVSHEKDQLVVSDGWYYIMVDTGRLKVRWKRLIDSNDMTREPAMRLTVGGDYLTVLKEDYDQKTIYMLSSRTGKVLWRTDPKDGRSPRPMHSTVFAPSAGSGQAAKAYGIVPHAGQGFYVVAVDCKTGVRLFTSEQVGYDTKPKATAMPRLYGNHLVVLTEDRQLFEVKVFDVKTGKLVHTLKKKGVAPFGVHGRMSATIQNGRAVLLSKDKLSL
jgi:outer membrane protein assembly factor BamB/tetratricopeptide (TPR) repeat protein